MDPYQREFGWHAVWSHEFIFPTAREEVEPILELIRGYLTTDYDFPSAIDAMRRDIDAASREILDGLEGEALERMRAANEVNLRMAPLTPDHHFYIDQGANAHVRLVLMAVGRKLVEAGRLDAPDDVMFLRYNELRMLIGSAEAVDAREIVAERRREREAAQRLHPRDWVGTVTPSQLAFPYLVNWGYPERFHQTQSEDERVITGIAASPGTIEGIARVVDTVDDFDDVRDGDILVCQMTNPGLGRPVHEDRRARHRHRWHDLAPGRAVARVRDPGRRRDVGRDPADRDRRPGARRRWRGPRRGAARRGRAPRRGQPGRRRGL